MKKPLIVIAGPTASGKTEIAIELAKKINGEIISADSMQVYKYMDIGTAKPTKSEMNDINHYLIDELYPDDDYSIVIFQSRAKKYLDEIYKKNKIPIICGGTGFYINALVYDNNFMETKNDESLRKELFQIAEQKGNNYLHEMLKKIDEQSYEKIHPNNIKRVVRAIEFFKITGQKISEHNKEEKKREEKYNTTFIILERNRQNLYERINKRIDVMIDSGLVEEVGNMLKKGYDKNLVSMQGLGYKEIVKYIQGDITLEDAITELKTETRRFAKRQLTWFRHQSNGTWIDVDTADIKEHINIIEGIYKKT